MGAAKSPGSSTTRLGKALGLCFIVMAMVSVLIGCVRFFIAQSMLRNGKFPVAYIEPYFVYGVTFHGSLARAGKVKSQTPKVEKTEKPKKPKGRAYKRLLYTKRFVNVANTPGGKRRMNPGPSSK
ncbi:hypothetical protein KL933_000944 [Ogataea haglerorum]|uniref:40S ribosomal protein S30 n=1 Tax=Ogataea haglerorum TaxID=1937702 RepID=A0AAN6D859_9ASCO|nr:hypothetical protein KL914_001947 [Ogataea haglerorum]KAG7729864.1 hypothetical protein KL933_000944 [Ogataea haglerorum]KAG7760226.1 hypothetical protein KL947_001070 [Ogataea haglerorum]